MDLTFEKWEDGRWFVVLPDYDEMTTKSMSKSQITNNQLFNWIWRFEIIIVYLQHRKGNSHEAINLKSIYVYKIHFLSQTCMAVHQRCL